MFMGNPDAAKNKLRNGLVAITGMHFHLTDRQLEMELNIPLSRETKKLYDDLLADV